MHSSLISWNIFGIHSIVVAHSAWSSDFRILNPQKHKSKVEENEGASVYQKY